MAKARLLQVACTVALLAAAPAFAQTNTTTGGTGAANAPTTMPDNATSTGTGGTTRHHARMTRRSGGMHSAKGADAQDAAVDRLNEQSYQAAHQGQSLGASGSGGSDTAAPSSSGGTSGGTSGGKM